MLVKSFYEKEEETWEDDEIQLFRRSVSQLPRSQGYVREYFCELLGIVSVPDSSRTAEESGILPIQYSSGSACKRTVSRWEPQRVHYVVIIAMCNVKKKYSVIT